MYNVKIDDVTKDAIRRGDTRVIVSLLKQGDRNIIKELKKHKGDRIAYLQGVSYMIDTLIELMDT